MNLNEAKKILSGIGAAIIGLTMASPEEAEAGGIPSSTIRAYKLFRKKGEDIYPLFVENNKPTPIGEWLEAVSGEQTASGKVKSKLGELAYRPGWHAGDSPSAKHIGGKFKGSVKPDYRPDDQVWAEVDLANDVDWQKIANSRALRNKEGQIIPRTAQITDQVPIGGHYRYKTNPNMEGEWLIGGDMRVNRILSDDEVIEINNKLGRSDLPRKNAIKYGTAGAMGATALAGNNAYASQWKNFKSDEEGLQDAYNPLDMAIAAATGGATLTLKAAAAALDPIIDTVSRQIFGE